MNYRIEAPSILRDFLVYHETIQGHSRRTVDEYYLDLRNFFRFLKTSKNLVPKDTQLDDISIADVDLSLVQDVTLTDIYSYMDYLSRERSLNNASRARKVATIRSFYKYLTNKAKLLETNPVQELDSPRLKKSLPKYLNLEESLELLDSVEGKNSSRDYCILTLFLNCGLRISELVGLNKSDVRGDQLRVLGKGNKERMVYLNDACVSAIERYNQYKAKNADIIHVKPQHKNAYFISRNGTRLSVMRIKELVKEHLDQAGLSQKHASAHKLRHTAATLMYQNGVDVRTIKEVLGHENLDTTAIYTHVVNDNLREAAEKNPLAKLGEGEK